MRKIHSVLIAVLFSSTVFAQSFQKGDINISAGIGVGAFEVKQNQILTFKNNNTATVYKDKEVSFAVSFILAIHFEYGITNKIGIGSGIKFNNYYISRPIKFNIIGPSASSDNLFSGINAFAFNLDINYHFLNSIKHDFSVGLGIGYDFPILLKRIEEKINNFDGNGITYQAGFNYNVYVSSWFGYFLNLEYERSVFNLDLKEFTNMDSSTDIKFNGVNTKIGVIFKI